LDILVADFIVRPGVREYRVLGGFAFEELLQLEGCSIQKTHYSINI
jgi:hypothetical protein